MSTLEHGQELVRFARQRIEQEFGGPKAEPPRGTWTDEKRATFVTLRWKHGDLQGCIGTLEADRPVVADVAGNAVAAATRDPRGEQLVLDAIKDLDVELSILSPLERIGGIDDIRPGTDGVVFVYRGRRGTFLPVMWETFPEKAEFIRQLERKAGLPANYDRAPPRGLGATPRPSSRTPPHHHDLVQIRRRQAAVHALPA